MNTLRICIVSALFHPNTGGPGRQSYIMAEKLIQKGVEVTVITRKLDIDIPRLNGVKTYFVRTARPERYSLSELSVLNIFIAASFSIGVMIRLFLMRKRFDIAHFYGASLPLLACLPLLKILGKKVVVKTTGGKGGREAGGLNGFFLKPLLVTIFKYTDVFIAISDAIHLRLLDEGYAENKIIKIPNGVDVNSFYPYLSKKKEELKKQYGLLDRKVLVYSGWLIERKGLDTLLEAMKLIVKERKETYLLLLGEGPLGERLKDKAASLGISNNVRFTGNVCNVLEFLNMADLFVFPPYWEGMPNSLLESMACGLPVIASRIEGIVDIIEDGKSGILFDRGDVSGLVAGTLRLLGDYKLSERLGAKARKRIEEVFSIDRVADEYIALYKKLIH